MSFCMIHFKCLRVSAGISLSFGKYFIGTSSGRTGRETFFVTSPIVIVLLFLPLLPSPPSPPLPPTGRKVPLVSQPLGAPFPESLLPLKDCPKPHFCVGGRNHVDFLRPGVGRDLPYREEVEWFTLR